MKARDPHTEDESMDQEDSALKEQGSRDSDEAHAREYLRKRQSPRGHGMNSFVKYSGMGFQMLAAILIFYWVGTKLDERSAGDKPVYTGILTVLGVFSGLYIALKDFIIRKDD